MLAVLGVAVRVSLAYSAISSWGTKNKAENMDNAKPPKILPPRARPPLPGGHPSLPLAAGAPVLGQGSPPWHAGPQYARSWHLEHFLSLPPAPQVAQRRRLAASATSSALSCSLAAKSSGTYPRAFCTRVGAPRCTSSSATSLRPCKRRQAVRQAPQGGKFSKRGATDAAQFPQPACVCRHCSSHIAATARQAPAC